jgi:hypothetical protein
LPAASSFAVSWFTASITFFAFVPSRNSRMPARALS